MAGDWIKMRCDLFTHPKVVRIASALKADKLRTVGGLMSVWCLFDAHSVDGKLEGYTLETLDSHLGWAGFSAAMRTVGWLLEDGENLELPRFDAHNGQSAKRRAQDADRKKAVRKTSAPKPDKKRTREEKRREEYINEITTVLDHLNAKAGRTYQPVEANAKFIRARLEEGATVDQCKAVIDRKVLQWKGDPEMDQYLRPATLFNATKFAQYSGETGGQSSSQGKFAGVK